MEITIFKNQEFGQVRTLTKDNEVWFVGKDIAKILGYTALEKMYTNVDKEDKIEINPQSQSYQGSCTNSITLEPNKNIFRMMLINESGLYNAIFGSKLSSAKKFKRWVTNEVLPSIRKHGAYMTDDTLEKALTSPDFLIQLATKLKEEKEARKLAENKNKLLNKENDALSQDVLEWADESIINALVRKYGASIGKFGDSWIEFKKSLLYKYSINLNSRITNYLNNTNKKTKPRTLSMLKGKEELTKGLKTAISMCREKEIDVSDILGKHLSNKEIDKMIS